jgi:hypothetical protein
MTPPWSVVNVILLGFIAFHLTEVCSFAILPVKSVLGPRYQQKRPVQFRDSLRHSTSHATSHAPSHAGNSSALQKAKSFIIGRGWSGKHVVTKEKLAKLGLNVLLAYGFVSNVSYITCVILAWIGHGRAFGLSPLAPGQWKSFLLIYSGFFAANNILRPLRFSLSLALSPLFNSMIQFLHERLHVRKSTATALLVFLVNVVGSISYLVLGLIAATRWMKVPLLP